MTRVYGTGTYDFKRHRVAEYPVEPPLPPSEDDVPQVDSKPASATPTLPNNITLSEIQRDRLTKIASANWLASSTSRRNYDAYLSFHGVDTRHTFISHLYRALCQKGVYTFKDREELEAGRRISELFDAIERSSVAIVTFSKNYAGSKWCLDELQKIMERKGQGKIVVIPIFYHVSPREVRLHKKENGEKGCYQFAMEEMETKYDSEAMKRWRAALLEGGNLSGIELGIGKDEGDAVQDVVDVVMNTLNCEYLEVAKHPEIQRDRLTKIASDNWFASFMSRRNYDAFLSFRGDDTRHTFISHLHRALCQKGVYTFKDREEVEAGQRISELFDAIEGSSVALVIFSENYARSKWCLDELQKIMERKGQGKIIVIPIFYRVNPREVRLHKKENGEKGCYQIAMEEMETKYEWDSETMKRWREALLEGGNLSGIELGIGKDEGDAVQDVVDVVMNTLNREYLEVAKHPIGIGRHLRAIRPSLQMDPHVDDVFMVGILGQGGAGMTTLSKAICKDIADRFDDWCFLDNVRDTTSRDFNGLAQLQQKLLQKLLGNKSLEVSSVDSGRQMIKHGLSEKRVLVILDDVEESVQLDALAGDLNWFGKGSRIILTTGNEHVLTANRVPIYKVNLLEREEAENLFRLHAFGTQEKINIDCGRVDPFDANLVRDIYETELKVMGGRKTVPLQRVMILEVSQYLENYLWPNFGTESATFEHVMSMILMVNEKFRENVAAWTCFYDRKDDFRGFLERVLRLKEGRELDIAERTNYLVFMINAFQSLEDEVVSEIVLRLASLESWHSLSYGRFQMELCLNPDLIKKWKRMIKRESKDALKNGGVFDPTTKLEVKFLRNLMGEFLEVLDFKVFPDRHDFDDHFDAYSLGKVDDVAVLYCERFVEFLIDLLSQLPTRRYLRPLVADVAVVAKCHLSALYKHTQGKLFAQLVDLLQFYEGFEINDHVGTQLKDDEVLQCHYDRFLAFQLLAFKKVPQLRVLALANVGSVHKRGDLSKKLSVLTPDELRDLVCNKLKLVSKEDPWSDRVDFLIEVMVSFFERHQSQKEAINALPLYPNEQIMWDESLVPSINYSGEGCLALPKLNLQFLTLHDYLLRNFNLFRLESTYEIREDIQEAVPHLLAYINNEGNTSFRGWSRMAVPIKEFKITEVKQPNIGEVKPASVTAEVTISISSYKAQIRSEWNALKEHDVLFLLSIRPSFEPLSAEEASKASVPQKLGLQFVRGCEIIEIRDEEGTLMNDFTGRIKREEWKPPKGELRTVTVALDAAQYHMDVTAIAEKGAEDVYGTFNILMRRKPKENNFKAILESIRDLMNEYCIVPDWLHNVFLGYGNPSAAQWTNMPDLLEAVDFKDTFLNADHVKESFSRYEVSFVDANGSENTNPGPPFRIKLPRTLKANTVALPGNKKSTSDSIADVDMVDTKNEKEKLIVEAYVPPDPGPYPQDQPKQNSVRFTPTQVGAIISGIQPGLTMVVGPPGTGKTDTAVQILNVLYHNCPSQRTLIITHSNQALNDLFEKIMQRDVPARYLLRLGQGEQELATDLDFSRQGRVNAMLVRRLELLSEVERLARSLGLPEDVGYTCETAGYFWLLHVYSRWEQFLAACADNEDKPSFVLDRFPFKDFFCDTPQPVFTGESFEKDMRSAEGCFRHLQIMFQELEECRAFELLKSTADRANYLMTKQAKIVAMTCTHAALKRKDFLQLGFKYDNLLMEESAQILEIETFIPMLLQRQEDGYARLKRCILIGDHHQLPPVVKNMAFQKYSHMDQSLFTRFVRLGIPYIELNAQGRARPSIAKLYNWRYRELGDLPFLMEEPVFHKANSGFTYDYQLIDVPDYHGKGETAPSPWFYQNEGEAEYVVSVYMYLRLLGYPANKISILTTYNGQKLLIRDVINRRCVPYSFIGPPSKVTTVDKFQGQQNDFILLSLVRTRFVGHLRDVRRLVVAMSRARLGLYVFCRRSLFEQCYELQPTFRLLLKRPDHLALNFYETTSYTDRHVEDTSEKYLVGGIDEMSGIVMNKIYQLHYLSLQAEQANTYYSTQVTGSANNEQDDETDSLPENDVTVNGSMPESTNDDAGEMLSESKTEEAASEDGVVKDKNGDSHSLKGEEGPTEMEVCRVADTDDATKMEE